MNVSDSCSVNTPLDMRISTFWVETIRKLYKCDSALQFTARDKYETLYERLAIQIRIKNVSPCICTPVMVGKLPKSEWGLIIFNMPSHQDCSWNMHEKWSLSYRWSSDSICALIELPLLQFSIFRPSVFCDGWISIRCATQDYRFCIQTNFLYGRINRGYWFVYIIEKT